VAQLWVIAWGLLVNFNIHAATPDFTVCKSTYALCTTALCKPILGKKGFVTCNCHVKTGFSAGEKACNGVVKTKYKEEVQSRYYPVKAYLQCANDRPWAYCLDSPCFIDSDDATKALCMCSLVKRQGKFKISLDDYVVVKGQHNKPNCTEGIYSSATVEDIDKISQFLKSQPDLHPFSIQIK